MMSNRCDSKISDTILVIDDEESILTMLEITFARKGFVVHTAQSGEEGLEKIDSNNYSLILTDLQMQGVSGNQIVHYVKDLKKSRVPVVGMSGTPWLLDREKFDVVLSKPADIRHILDVVRQCIKKAAYQSIRDCVEAFERETTSPLHFRYSHSI